jgi:hypothetical protein
LQPTSPSGATLPFASPQLFKVLLCETKMAPHEEVWIA